MTRLTRRSIILAGLKENKETVAIVEEVIKSFPDADQRKVKNQIFTNKSLLSKVSETEAN